MADPKLSDFLRDVAKDADDKAEWYEAQAWRMVAVAESLERTAGLVSMPRCATCRHWDRARDLDFGSCGRILDSADPAEPSIEVDDPYIGRHLSTPADFGCTLHEPADLEENQK